MSPPSPSIHVAKTIDRPFGVHAGDSSTTSLDVVRRRGVPPFTSITQTLPSAVNATRLPSGESAGSRISRTGTESPIVADPFTNAPSDWSTSAVNGIGVVVPDGTSTRHSFPPNEVTIALPFGSHADVGSGPTLE